MCVAPTPHSRPCAEPYCAPGHRGETSGSPWGNDRQGKAGLGEPRLLKGDLELRWVDKEELARQGVCVRACMCVCVLWGAALNLLAKRKLGHGTASARLFLTVW